MEFVTNKTLTLEYMYNLKFFHSYEFKQMFWYLGLYEENLVQVDPNDRKSPWRCLLCIKDFASKSNTMRHIETLHTATPTLQCNICQRMLKNKNSLSNHMIIIHGQNKGVRTQFRMENWYSTVNSMYL